MKPSAGQPVPDPMRVPALGVLGWCLYTGMTRSLCAFELPLDAELGVQERDWNETMCTSRSKDRVSARSAQPPMCIRLTLREFVYSDGGIERGALVQAERVGKLVHGRYRVDAIKRALVAAADVRISVPSAALDAQHVDRGALCLCSAAHQVREVWPEVEEIEGRIDDDILRPPGVLSGLRAIVHESLIVLYRPVRPPPESVATFSN